MSEEDPGDARRKRNLNPTRIDQLTPREQEVARKLVEGMG